MGQTDVYDILKEEHNKDKDKWFSVNAIKEILKLKGFSEAVIRAAPNDLIKLASFNLIEVKGVGIWNHEKHFKGK